MTNSGSVEVVAVNLLRDVDKVVNVEQVFPVLEAPVSGLLTESCVEVAAFHTSHASLFIDKLEPTV